MSSDMELFGCFVYAQDLSYEELLRCESDIKEHVDRVLFEEGGEFLEFEERGDCLRFQASLRDARPGTGRALSLKIALAAPKGLDGSLLFVDKDLRALYACTLRNGKWQENTINLPAPGSLNRLASKLSRIL